MDIIKCEKVFAGIFFFKLVWDQNESVFTPNVINLIIGKSKKGT